ncbi:alpha/beta hydrolase-fold protein [Escherichia coli]|uniref:alpha/beta hydrolase-fold protein n=1 Tax=Escherichia coli TaxID=562 RepID=UPI0030CF15C0
MSILHGRETHLFSLPGWDPDVDYSGGKGALYVDFIVNTLKNYIDSNFRTLPDRNNTAIAGGVLWVRTSVCLPQFFVQDVFSKVGVFSPALWFNDSAMLNFIQENNIFADLTVYLDVGTLETSGMREDFPEVYISGAEKLCVSLRKQRNVTIDYHLWGGDTLPESAWAKRFPEMLKLFWLLMKPVKDVECIILKQPQILIVFKFNGCRFATNC